MAGQVFLTVYDQGNAFEHPVVFDRGDPASWVHEFEHQVLYLGDKLFFDRSPIRVHKPVRLLVPVDKITPQLIQLVVQGATVEKVMLRWFQYQEKTKSDTEYFRHLFETVAFEQFRLVLPDVKDPLFTHYDHALELSFRYKRAVWTYMHGNLIVSDEWQSPFSEEGEIEEEVEPETSEELAENTPEQIVEENASEVKLSDAKFLPEEGKTDFNKECNVTVNVEYLCETNKKKVLFKLFSIYNNTTQDMQYEMEAFESGGKADAKMTLHYNDEYYSDTTKPSEATVEYYVKVSHPEADEIESERLKLPFRKLQTVQFIEIPDVLFNHNSAVPCIDANETLVGAIVTIIVYAYNNPDKEIVIYGHTDSSGETDYNLELSELRCKSIKALLDNKPDDFVNVCIGKFKVEDYQTILTALAKTYNWDCDTGAIDNQNGPKTEAALKNFQIDYNLFFEQSIDEDGKIGKQTWGALFKVIRDIIWNIASKETRGTIPTLKYGKEGSGITACGEKFAKDAYARKGRKSKEDRRVEIVFSDPSEPIEDTPYVDTIVMEPIDIKATVPQQPATKIKSITAYCEHTNQGKRIAHWGEKLQIVPDAVGDNVTFTIESDSPPENISWSGPSLSKTQTGYSITHRYSGITSELKNWFVNLISGTPPFIPDSTMKILSIDSISKDKKQVMVELFPITKKEYDFDLKKYLSSIKKFTDRFNKACNFVGQEIKFKYLEGKITAYGQYKEVPGQKDVFFNFGVEGGFKPLFGAHTLIKFPLDGVAWIPSQIKKYIAEIEATIELEGNLSFTIFVERSEPSKVETGGNLSGEIVVKLGLRANLGNKKLLFVWLKIGSGITGEGKVFAEKNVSQQNEKWNIKAVAGAKWNGLKGEISWSILNGTWEKDLAITILEPEKLGETELVLY
ncbi:MAG: type VI secretion system tube protein Hcp [Chitinispirillaceae bacterium]|nr:type VI secretion system tube protein Hcp [Chitinispirillaceae bacterium]